MNRLFTRLLCLFYSIHLLSLNPGKETRQNKAVLACTAEQQVRERHCFLVSQVPSVTVSEINDMVLVHQVARQLECRHDFGNVV